MQSLDLSGKQPLLIEIIRRSIPNYRTPNSVFASKIPICHKLQQKLGIPEVSNSGAIVYSIRKGLANPAPAIKQTDGEA